MKPQLIFLLKYYLYWMLFSTASRLLFVLFFLGETAGFGVYEFAMIFWKGWRMDLSLGGYVMMASCVLLALFNFLPARWEKAFFRVFTFVLLVVFGIIVLGDMQGFRVWGYHLDSAVIEYLKSPKEAMASGTVGAWIFSIVALFAIVGGFGFLAKRWLWRGLKAGRRAWWQAFVYLFIGGAMILPVRGGLNVSPMNISFVFFSNKYPFANQAAINPVWNFLWELAHYNRHKASFWFMPQAEADAILREIYATEQASPRLLTTDKPNVVVVLLESFTANAVGALGSPRGATPNLDKLAEDGLLFSRIYATGARSDRGLAGVLAAIPSHPAAPVLGMPKRVASLRAFSRDMEDNGYDTYFYYAGDLNFFGFRAFTTSNFKHLITEDDFSEVGANNKMKWGVHDGDMFDRLYDDLAASRTPSLFFAFTLSSHEPFDVPGSERLKGASTSDMFLNSVAYTDDQLGRFIDKCKQSGIWDNTLYICIADHGVRYVGNPEPDAPASFHIPLVFSGGALAVRDSVINTIGSQTDLAAMLLGQLGIDHSTYKYSRNLLADSTAQVAFYANPSAVGVVTPQGTTTYNTQGRAFMRGDTITTNRPKLEAYLQTIDSEQMN